MALPRVKIAYKNGQLGTVGQSADGLLALVIGAALVLGKFALNKAYSIYSLDDLGNLGITEENNPELHRQVKAFYAEADNGTELVIYGVDPTVTMTEIFDYESTAPGSIRHLVTSENGKLRGVLVAGINSKSSDTSAEGLDADVFTALPVAQQLADWATETLYAPLFVVLEGKGYDSSKDLKDLSEATYNRVGILIGDDSAESKGALVGCLAGRIASIAVQRNIGRVKSGALFPSKMYVGDKLVDESESVITSIHDKRYITFRLYVGRSGYYFTDDNLACKSTDDYAQLANRRVIDKAYRITYDTLLDELLDDLTLNTDGTMIPAVVKAIEQSVESTLAKSMTVAGELSASDEDDYGCKCSIDVTQNVLANSRLDVEIGVRPHGYNRLINVKLGFLVES